METTSPTASEKEKLKGLEHTLKELKAGRVPSNAQMTTEPRRSGSSELTDLTSEVSSSQESTQESSSEGSTASEITSTANHDSSTQDGQQNYQENEGDDLDAESFYPSEEELVNDTYTGKAPSREERVKYRDLLNTKLEQMFVKANIELSPFARVPWKKLGEALVSRKCYITGFPEAFAPKAVNDQLTGGTAPSTWSINRTKPLLALIESGQLRIEQRPSGRKVLFELTRPDGTTYDSTIGYSTKWLQTNMPDAFPSKKRGRSEMAARSKSRSPLGHREPDEDDWSDESLYDLAGKSAPWSHFHSSHKRQKLHESRSSSRVNDRRRSGTSSRGHQPEKPKKMMDGIKTGQKWTEGGIVKKVGRGWIVVEDSSDTETTQGKSTPTGSTSKPMEETVVEQPTSRKRKRSEPPESQPQPNKRIHPDDSSVKQPDVVSNVNRLPIVMGRIGKMIRDAGYNGSKKTPWSSLPLFLCQRSLYITGFPDSCLPKVVNDQVKVASSPQYWKPTQWVAMEDALNRGLVKILGRPTNRLVLFETTGIDGKVYDSTCGFSSAWIDKNMKHYSPTPSSSTSKAKQPAAQKPLQAKPTSRSSRPSLKLVIPNTGQSVSEKPAPSIKIAKNVPSQRTEKEKSDKPHRLSSPKIPPSQIPRSNLPAPTILLQPPTPPAGGSLNIPTEKLQLAESPMHESPSGVSSTSMQAPLSSKLSPPPSPPPVEPVALPGSPADSSPQHKETKPLPTRSAFTFKIPPAKSNSNVDGRKELYISLKNKHKFKLIDENRMDYDMIGLDLGMMFDSPSRENPSGGLPSHLQPKVAHQPESSGALKRSTLASGAHTAADCVNGPFAHTAEIVATLPLNGTLDSRYAIEKRIRPSLVKLFDAAGLSSSGVPIPWVMLPALLCERRLFISGFPRQCLPRVVRDKVEGSSGPRGWDHQALLAMFNALNANEVKIKRRPRGRKVLFHLLPTDTQREMGDNEGVDSTLSFSKTWLDEHMVDYPEDVTNGSMDLEPSDAPVILREPVLTPLRRDSVWERFGKITIEESESEDENRVPDPPWKTALEQFIRPSRPTDKAAQSSGASKTQSSVTSEDETDQDDSDEDVWPPLQISHLLPSRLPHPFQGKGRILLSRDDRFEWIPTDAYTTNNPPTRMVWSPSKERWKLLSELRDFTAFGNRAVRLEIPNRISGKILGRGVVEHNAGQGIWECSFVGRGVFGDLRWSPDVAAWEWFPQDVDGRRKWVGISGRDYDSPQESS